MKAMLLQSKLNLLALLAILLFIAIGKSSYPQFTQSVFVKADQLVSDLILVFVAITLGAFIANFATWYWAAWRHLSLPVFCLVKGLYFNISLRTI